MNYIMKKIAIVTNFNIFEKVNAAMRVVAKLSKFDCRIWIASFNKERILRAKRDDRAVEYVSADKIYTESDLIIVLGGDGTILEAARRAAERSVMILGVNLGRVGYMAELELSELDMLSRLFDGDYKVEERSMLSVEIVSAKKNAKKISAFALNDAVISNGSVARIVDLELSEGGVPISTYRADGLIVATPTGSTAYSMSAGGPITDPRVNCLCVTPICPHSLVARPLIFPDDAILEVKNICVREKLLYLTLDGRNNYEIYTGDTVKITKSDMKTRLIRLNDSGFYTRLRKKMSDTAN